MKPKKHLTPHAPDAALPATERALRPGEATAAKFELVTKEEIEAGRSKAYAYIRFDDIINGRV